MKNVKEKVKCCEWKISTCAHSMRRVPRILNCSTDERKTRFRLGFFRVFSAVKNLKNLLKLKVELKNIHLSSLLTFSLHFSNFC